MVTIKNVKEELNKHLGDEVTIKYNLGRNKYEKYTIPNQYFFSAACVGGLR